MMARARIERFLRYATVGVISNLLGYGVFLALLFSGLAPVLTTGLTYLIMVSVSYFVNRRWSFRSANSHAEDLWRYLLAYGVGLGVSMLSMAFLERLMHPAVAQVLVIGLAAMSIFATLEGLRFGRTPATRSR